MKTLINTISACLALACAGTYAQDSKLAQSPVPGGETSGIYDGTWERSKTDRLSQIILTLKGNSGSAQIYAKAGNSNCFRGNIPVEIASATTDSISVVYKFTAIAPQCNDESATFNRTTENGVLRLVSSTNSFAFFVKK